MVVKKPKKRISVTLTQGQIEATDKMIEAGLFLNIGAIMREGLRMVLMKHGISLSQDDE